MKRSAALGLGLVLVFLAFHLPYLPKSLEDLDSINFALGLRHYDVPRHQPHPPGYPIYILIGKAIHAIGPSEVATLSLVSIAAGALGALAIVAFYRRVADDGTWWPEVAALVAVTSPMYWFTAERPLSDMAGLAAAVGIQTMTLAATTERRLAIVSLLAGLATGIRSQVAWLTVPLIVLVAARLFLDREQPRHRPARIGVSATFAFAAGALAWAIPLVILSGGPRAYWAALSFQGSADIGNIQMLWTRHGLRDIADALYYACVAPWVMWTVASVVLVFAVAGTMALLIRSRRALLVLAAAFAPYFLFDVLFQETFTSRYALPLVIPIAYLAAAGLRLLPWRSGAAVAAAVAMFDAHLAGTSLSQYGSEKAPAFRLLDDMAADVRTARERPVLAMDRKQAFDLRRPFVWIEGGLAQFAATLRVPPQHEWLEAAKYWAEGGRAPVWFVVDPKRTMIDLVQHGDPSAYRWLLKYPVLVGGARPDEMDFYRVDAPDWFVGEGWALTPEAAGIAEADRKGLAFGPIDGWISRRVVGGDMIIGGRNFSAAPTTISLDAEASGAPVLPSFVAPPGPFLQMVHFGDAPTDQAGYLKITLRAAPPVPAAIEQFDAASRRGGRLAIFGFGPGWHEPEFNPKTGASWRWLSERGELRFASATPRLALHVEGESPLVYFSRGSRLVVRAGDRVAFDDVLTADFKLDIPIADGTQVVTFETDQVYQPADRSRRTADRRHLGLRIFKVDVRPVS